VVTAGKILKSLTIVPNSHFGKLVVLRY
jgi:hypothetical protein